MSITHAHQCVCMTMKMRAVNGVLSMQAMERRYTALADQQGKLAAEKEKLSSEKQALMEVRAGLICCPMLAGICASRLCLSMNDLMITI